MGVPARFVGHRNNVKFDPEFFTGFGVVDQLCTYRLPFFKCCINTVKFGALGFRPLQKSGRLADHFFTAVAGPALKSIVDKNNARTRIIKRLSLSDQHNVVQA